MTRFIARQIIFIAKVLASSLIVYLIAFVGYAYWYSKIEHWDWLFNPLSYNDCFYNKAEFEKAELKKKTNQLDYIVVDGKHKINPDDVRRLEQEEAKQEFAEGPPPNDSVFWDCSSEMAQRDAKEVITPYILSVLGIYYAYLILDWARRNR